MSDFTRVLFFTFACSIMACGSLAIAAPDQAQGSAENAAKKNSQKAVLVTGASTGIGRKTTELLAAKGYFVYAGARKKSDLAELNKIKNVQSIRLDVTIPADIDAAVETITSAGRGLYGLVNNAGVATLGPLIEVQESDLAFVFDVNVFGPYRITKAFSPLIIAEKGRITTISSIAGILSGPLLGAYSMSKHAMEAYTDSLAAELARLGVKVSAIEPGNYRSNISSSSKKRMMANKKGIEGSLFQKELRAWMDRPSNRAQYEEPDAVAEAVLHALFDDKPKVRYMVVPNQQEAEATIRKAIQELVQLNEKQPYSYSRDKLILMLDEATAEPDK